MSVRNLLLRGSVLLGAAIAIAVSARPAMVSAQLPGQHITTVTVSAVAQRDVLRAGDHLVVAVVLDHAPGIHTWPNQPVVPPEFGADFPAIATTIDVLGAPPGATAHPLQWPAPEVVTVYYTLSPVPLLSYTGRAIAYVPFTLPPDAAAGESAVEVMVVFQACDATTCYPPEEKTLAVPVTIVAAGPTAGGTTGDPALFAGFDLSILGEGATLPVAETIELGAFGWSMRLDPSGPLGLAALLLAALIGGFLLNLTPCVLPVIPLKMMGLRSGAGNPQRLLFLGFVMSLGVVFFWLVLGGAIAFVAGFDTISSLFQTRWFAFGVGVVVAVMALGMFDLFEIQLPQAVYRVRADQESPGGSFLFGIMTAVLSTPCTAPFMGATAAWAATQSPPITLSTFAAIGVGMALPYVALSARPGLVSRVPRSGPASVVVKQVLGLVMMAVATFFLGLGLSSALQQPPDPPSRVYWWFVVAWIVAACAWLAWRTLALASTRRTRVVLVAVALVGALGSLGLGRSLASHGPIDWVYYTPERFTAAAERGDVILLDFTAEWCLNCRALESGVLHQPEVVELMASADVVPMRVDLTCDNQIGKAKLLELDWVGIPLLAVFGPGTGYEQPLKYDTYTIDVVRDAMAEVRGTARAGGS